MTVRERRKTQSDPKVNCLTTTTTTTAVTTAEAAETTVSLPQTEVFHFSTQTRQCWTFYHHHYHPKTAAFLSLSSSLYISGAQIHLQRTASHRLDSTSGFHFSAH